MKKLKLLFSALALLYFVSASAYDFKVDGICYNNTSTSLKLTVSVAESFWAGPLTIPESVIYNGNIYIVTSIGERAFDDCYNLTSVVIPNSVESIGDSAFYGCSDLTSIEIPNSVTSIGERAFCGCYGLTSVTIGNSVTSIGERAFYGCDGLNLVEIPNSVTSIGIGAFRDCSGLTAVTIGNSVTSIGSSAFRDCSGLTSIKIPNSVTSIGNYAFDGTKWYDNLSRGPVYINNVLYDYKGSFLLGESIEIKEGTVSISGSAFEDCRGLTSVTIPNSVTSIGDNAFRNCDGLKEVHISDIAAWCSLKFEGESSNPLGYAHHLFLKGEEVKDLIIPEGVESIGKSAFSGCDGLTSVVIGDSVTSIGCYAFSGCDSLTSVTIGNSVTSIGEGAFRSCAKLTTVNFNAKNCGITYDDDNLFEEWFKKCSNLSTINIGNKVVTIPDKAFYLCRGLTEVTIGNSVTSIGEEAFYYCDSLTSVVIPNSVTSIGGYAFSGCDGLKEVHISDIAAWCSLKFESTTSNPLYFAHHLFLKGEEVKDLIIPEGVTSIGYSAFYNCSGLASIEIPNSVTSIENYAFKGCSGLTSVEIPNSVTSIGNYAFKGCSGLTSVEIPNSVTSIGVSVFDGCSGLTSVTIGDSVTSIGERAFCNCDGLTSIEIPNSVTSIGDYAFFDCNRLTSVTIGNSVTSIGYSAFSVVIDFDTSGGVLKTVNSYAKVPPTIDPFTFGYEKDNATLHVVKGCKNAYASDENWKGFLNIIDDLLIISESILLDKTNISTVAGETVVLTATIYPEDATDKKVVWTSSDSKVASVVEGRVTARKVGTATITATTTDGSNLTATCKVTVKPTLATSISLDKTAVALKETESVTLTATVLPETTSNKETVWTSSDSEVATVENGVVTAHKIGTATITATTTDGSNLTATCKVTVKPTLATSISLDKTAVALKETESVTLTATVLPETTINKEVVWASSNSEVASVVEGEVTAHKVGTATITATTTDGSNLTASCRVTVKSTPYFEAVNSDGKTIYYNITSNDNLTVEVTCKGSKYNEYSDEYSGSINIPSSVFFNGKTYSVTSIGASVFRGCRGLTSVTIPNSVTSIGEYAFRECSGLTSVTIGNSVTSIGSSAFYGCRGLTSIEIPNSVTSIGVSAFDGCSGLTRVNINCDSIGSWFERNMSMKEVVIGDSVTSIGEHAFYNCSGLTSVIIGNSVESIGNSAFRGCSKITDVYCYAEKVPSTESSAFGGSYVEYATLHVPAESIEDYKATEPWSGFGKIVALTEETGIEDIAVEDININDAPVYNLQGMKMQNADNLPKGIYIKGGKKYMVK